MAVSMRATKAVHRSRRVFRMLAVILRYGTYSIISHIIKDCSTGWHTKTPIWVVVPAICSLNPHKCLQAPLWCFTWSINPPTNSLRMQDLEKNIVNLLQLMTYVQWAHLWATTNGGPFDVRPEEWAHLVGEWSWLIFSSARMADSAAELALIFV